MENELGRKFYKRKPLKQRMVDSLIEELEKVIERIQKLSK